MRAGDGAPPPTLTCVSLSVPINASSLPQELGASALGKRPTSCMLILPKAPKGSADDDETKEFEEAYAELEKKIKGINGV